MSDQPNRRREYLDEVDRREIELITAGKRQIVLVDRATGKRIRVRIVRTFEDSNENS